MLKWLADAIKLRVTTPKQISFIQVASLIKLAEDSVFIRQHNSFDSTGGLCFMAVKSALNIHRIIVEIFRVKSVVRRVCAMRAVSIRKVPNLTLA